jgi:hypothetical protein
VTRPKNKRRGGRPKSRTTLLGPKIVRRILDPEHGELCGPAFIKQGEAVRPAPRWMLILHLLGPEAAAEAEIRRVKAAHKRLGAVTQNVAKREADGVTDRTPRRPSRMWLIAVSHPQWPEMSRRRPLSREQTVD